MSCEQLNELWSKTNLILKKQNNYRALFPYYAGKNKNNIEVDFASNDYLALKNDGRIIDAGYEAAQKCGAGSGSSRIVIQTDSVLADLEGLSSKVTGYAHSLFFPSGFIANVSVFDALSPYAWEEEHFSQEIFIDHRCHSSLFFGLKSANLKYTVFRHGDDEHLALKLRNSSAEVKIIVVESLYSMDGDFSDPEKLYQICKEFSAVLIVDETHSIGVYGKDGAGLYSNIPKLKNYIMAATFGCGKAIGVQGGFIATDCTEFKERILQKARPLLFSTAPSPFITGAVKRAIEIIFSEEGQRKREDLYTKCAYFKEKMTYKAQGDSHIFPMIYGENFLAIQKEQELLKNKILVKAIRPPTVPRNTARLRVIIRANHSFADIDKLVSYLC